MKHLKFKASLSNSPKSGIEAAREIIAHRNLVAHQISSATEVEREFAKLQKSTTSVGNSVKAVERALSSQIRQSRPYGEGEVVRRVRELENSSSLAIIRKSVSERAKIYAESTRKEFSERASQARLVLTGAEGSAMAGVSVVPSRKTRKL